MSLTLALPPLHGARLELQGTCNQCGLCCTMEHEGQRLVCEYLDAMVSGGRVPPLGTSLASQCRVYESRDRRWPLRIRLKDGAGVVQRTGRCFKDTWQEDQAIAERGIGRGCSLTLPVTEGELVTFTADGRA